MKHILINLLYGKVEVSSSELIYLSNALKKPILYFFPKQLLRELRYKDDLESDPLLSELLLLGGRLDDDDLKPIMAQIRAIIEMRNEELIGLDRELTERAEKELDDQN